MRQYNNVSSGEMRNLSTALLEMMVRSTPDSNSTVCGIVTSCLVHFSQTNGPMGQRGLRESWIMVNVFSEPDYELATLPNLASPEMAKNPSRFWRTVLRMTASNTSSRARRPSTVFWPSSRTTRTATPAEPTRYETLTCLSLSTLNENLPNFKHRTNSLAVHENIGERLQSIAGGQGVPPEGSGAVAVVSRLVEVKDDDYRVCSFEF